jgi:hypothetical protein
MTLAQRGSSRAQGSFRAGSMLGRVSPLTSHTIASGAPSESVQWQYGKAPVHVSVVGHCGAVAQGIVHWFTLTPTNLQRPP